MTIAFRPAARADRTFIVHAWLSSYRTAHSAGLIPMEDWSRTMWPVIEKILDRPATTTIVAHDPDATDHIADLHGFIVADVTPGPPLVMYVFVKETYRRWGYARGLFESVGINPEAPFIYACKTAVVSTLTRKIPCAKFDNNAARYLYKIDPKRRTA